MFEKGHHSQTLNSGKEVYIIDFGRARKTEYKQEKCHEQESTSMYKCMYHAVPQTMHLTDDRRNSYEMQTKNDGSVWAGNLWDKVTNKMQ